MQRFKGLESRVIILCDVEDIFEENYQKFMYLSATRARGLLYVLQKENDTTNA